MTTAYHFCLDNLEGNQHIYTYTHKLRKLDRVNVRIPERMGLCLLRLGANPPLLLSTRSIPCILWAVCSEWKLVKLPLPPLMCIQVATISLRPYFSLALFLHKPTYSNEEIHSAFLYELTLIRTPVNVSF